jgi:glycolate oxidase FAD binding subunit
VSSVVTLKPTTAEEVQEAVRSHPKLLPRGGGSKEALSTPPAGVVALELLSLTGVLDYDPGEFTFTALAGTTLKEVEGLLEANGQYLPFDPPLTASGATLGGTVAAAMSGSGRNRYGGVRDFILGVQIVDGAGKLVRGGGKVVKNAAGFDLPKLMVGSFGRLGAIVEVTFKVFPRPEAQRTIRVTCRDLADALGRIAQLVRQPFDLEALDLEPTGHALVIRVAGNGDAIDDHAQRVAAFTERRCDVLAADEADGYWYAQREFEWVGADCRLIKLAITPRDVPAIESAIASAGEVVRRYAVAGNVAWLAWPTDRAWPALPVSGLVVRGEADGASPRVGPMSAEAAPFAQRIKRALDPEGRFAPLV